MPSFQPPSSTDSANWRTTIGAIPARRIVQVVTMLAIALDVMDVDVLLGAAAPFLRDLVAGDLAMIGGVFAPTFAERRPLSAAEETHETVGCNLCGSQSYRVIYPAAPHQPGARNMAETFRSSADEGLVDQLVECTSCRLRYLTPRLKADAIVTAYREGEDPTFVSQVGGRERTFSACLDEIEAQTGGRLGCILDIGTAGGSFLHVAAQRGWQVEGCEPNEWLCDWGKQHYGLDIRPGTLLDHTYPDHRFDVITLWDVLEHVPDPKAVILECRRILKPGGLLVVNYPDIGSWIARVMGRSWVFLLSVHLYYFTRPTMTRLLTDAGFAVERIGPHWQWLGLAYVLRRAEPQIGALGRVLARIADGAGLGRLHVPYWIGQSRVVAREAGHPRVMP